MTDRLRQKLFIAITAAAVIAVCLVLVLATELVFRSHFKTAYFGRYAHDSTLGWRFFPGIEFTFRTAGIENKIRTTSEGLRKLPAAGGRRKIAVFGDSFTSNLSVKDNEVFTSVLNDELGPDGWTVKNYGINGFGTVQEFLLYQDAVKKDGPFDLVIVLFLAENDFDDNTFPWLFVEGRDRPYLAKDPQSGHPQIAGLPVEDNLAIDLKSFFMFHSAIGRAVLTPSRADWVKSNEVTPEMWPYPKGMLGLPGILRYGVSNPAPPTVFIEKTTNHFLKQFNDEVVRDGGRFLLVMAPSHYDFSESEWTAFQKDLRSQLNWDLAHGEPYQRMGAALDQLGVPYLNLYPVFQGKPVFSLYNENELHWTAAGNRLTAETIRDWVRAQTAGNPAAPDGPAK